MRTDIPAFYADWLFCRIKQGFFVVRNPYNENHLTRHAFTPEVTDLLMLTTKNPLPVVRRIDRLKAFRQLWNITVTPYGRDLEPNVPPPSEVIAAAAFLAKHIGTDRILWRYDPVIVDARYPVDFHLEAFGRMCRQLKASVAAVIVSFVQIYPKLRTLAPYIKEVTPSDKSILINGFAEIAAKHNLKLKLCYGYHETAPAGVDTDGCVTQSLLEQTAGYRLLLPKAKPKREHCACYLGFDMGAYNSCPHLCRYCYANTSADIVTKAFNRHNPQSPLLIGDIKADDKIEIAADKTYRDDGVLF